MEHALMSNKAIIITKAVLGGLGILVVLIGLGILPLALLYRYIMHALSTSQSHWLGVIGNVTVLLLMVVCAVWVCAAAGMIILESLRLLSMTVTVSSDGIELRTNRKNSQIEWQVVQHIICEPSVVIIIFRWKGDMSIVYVSRSLIGESSFDELICSLKTYTRVIEEPQDKQKVRAEYNLHNVFNRRKRRLSTLLR